MSNVTPIRGPDGARRARLSLRGQMVLGYISEEAYWRALAHANGGQVIRFVKPPKEPQS